ncbi:MAG: PRC-barrel domain-containing protein [Phyllobacterium sp.]
MKTFLAIPLVVTLLATTALAQQGPGLFARQAAEDSAPQDRYLVASPGQVLTSGLVGQAVYNGSGDDAVSIGEVTDVVLDPDGVAQAALVGVGGFLGVGEKDVAIGLDRLSWAEKPDKKRWLVIDASKEELEKAPAFDRAALLTDGAADPEKAPVPEVAPAEKSTDAEKPAAAPRSALKPVPSTAMSADKLIGSVVYGPEDETLGSVGDALMTPDGQMEAFVVDVGGFLGLGKKPIAISIENLDLMADESGKISVFTPFTKKELEAHPAYTAEAYKADSEKILLRGAAE